MRLKARTRFDYQGKEYKREDILDVADDEGRLLLNRDLVMPWNLEDPTQRSEGVAAPEAPMWDVPPVALSPTEASVSAVGGAGSFTVTITGAGTSGTWTVDKDADADWLTVISPTTPQSTDGVVDYGAVANAGEERVAHCYVNGKTFTVTQAGLSASSISRRRHEK